VAEYARARLGAGKVVLMGISFGTLLGLEMIQRRPDLFSAYVGTSQTVGLASLRAGYDLALADCRRRGNEAAVAALIEAGPPPYASLDKFLVRQTYTNPPGQPMTAADQARSAAATSVMKAAPTTGVRYLSGLPNPQGYHPGNAFIGTLDAMFGQTGNWDARKLGRDFEVPIHIFQGDNDFNTPAAPVQAWLKEVRAPAKVFATLPGASHNTVPYHAEMLALLRRHVWPVARRAA
jgi:pimeloyl-ACP methyl ester carboxylesterase